MRVIKAKADSADKNGKQNKAGKSTDGIIGAAPFFGLQMRERDRVLVSGVRRVTGCDGTRVLLLLSGGGKTAVCGSALLCTVFTDKTVEVRGRIEKIAFSGREVEP